MVAGSNPASGGFASKSLLSNFVLNNLGDGMNKGQVSTGGLIVGLIIIIMGIWTIFTFTNPTYLYSLGFNIATVNAIQQQWGVWGPIAGLGVIAAGIGVMYKFGQ